MEAYIRPQAMACGLVAYPIMRGAQKTGLGPQPVAPFAASQPHQLHWMENDTLSSISLNYAVPMVAIKEYNGLSTDSVFLGQGLLIPLCERAATPGPSPTPTNPPPYPAPSLLLPADGGAFTLANDVVTLQWSSVGTLEDNEIYQVIVEDITAGQARRLTEYETDTKFIVPTTFRPNDNVAHVIRWRITTVRQSGTDEQGQPIYISAGADSLNWVFTWVGSAPQQTPEP